MVSIIVPAYNSEKHLRDCINSVICQTFRELELIIVDNNSTDKTAQIIKKAAESDGRIKYLFCPVPGVSNARNAGIAYSCGDYVFFLDSDDTLINNAIEILHRVAEEDDLDITACNILYSSEKGRSPMEGSAKTAVAKGTDIPLLFSDMLTSYVWYMVFKLFRRSILIENNILFSTKLAVGEDLDFVIRAIEKSEAVCFIDTPLYIYNITQNGLNLKYHENLYELKAILYNSVKAYLIKNELPLENLHINLVNDIFALAVNEQKSQKPDFDRLLRHELTNELIKNDPVGKLSVSKRVFLICLKYRLKFALDILTKIWIRS